MNDHKIENRDTLKDSKGQVVGTVDHRGQVRDGWRDKGAVHDDRYVDEHGRDHGWVKQTSSGGGGEAAGILIVLFLFLGVFYLAYLGIQRGIEEIRKGRGYASRLWGFLSIPLPPLFVLAIWNGKAALAELARNGGSEDERKAAKTGISLGYFGGLLLIGLIMAALVYAVVYAVSEFDMFHDIFGTW